MSYTLANYLANKGYRVVFISHVPKFDERLFFKVGTGEIIVYSWVSKNRPTTLKDFFWYLKLHFKYKPKTVIGHFVGGNIPIMTSKLFSFGKTQTFDYYHTITGAHNEDLNLKQVKYRWFIFRKKMFYHLFCNHIICPSEISKSDLKNFYNYTNGVVVVNPMLDRYEESKAVKNTNNIIISYLGRFEPTKGIVDLITAFNEFVVSNPNTKIRLQIAGNGSQEKLIKDLIVKNEDITFFGKIPYADIDEYIRKSYFTIIPSKFDNLPTVGLESLMNAIPVLLSTNTGLTPYLQDSINCFTFNPNVKEIMEVFSKVELSMEKYSEMSLNAREFYLEKFSMNEYCESIYKIIK
ncbi:glycosyltransferase [Flavobacterium amnicola]|uniref:Glycosyltransferase n=1 Tax=Flavobacterium amnicola TaxID=2506422 RepID=A0A4Q1K1E6_9FLAO|nr:glycosyltransferase family 4 protein [Flavobacterium amnicola]RXR17744.1 glycosyltransferase [Flavobacterium amnicola]